MTNQRGAPLFDGLRRYLSKNFAAFHTPGHRGGAGLTEMASSDWAALDLTEVTDDDGSEVQSWRGEAERAAAEFFGADETFFLANGATEGILALCLSAGAPGDRVIVGRDCHLSVIHGIILAGLRPVFAEPRWISGTALPSLPNSDTLNLWIERYPEAKAVWLTHPGYAGIVGDLRPLAELAHRAGMMLLIDEAHGGYLNLAGLNVAEARDVADGWVHGAHKMMGSLTQTGLLHIRGPRLDRGRLVSALDWVRSTSPSYPLLSSLDLMRRRLSDRGGEPFRAVARRFAELRRVLHDCGIEVLEESPADSYRLDPMKLVISWLNQGLTGLEARRRLIREHHIQPEYADRDRLVFFGSPVQPAEDFQRLAKAAKEMGVINREPLAPTGPPPLKSGPLEMPPREAAFQPYDVVALEAAVGRNAASSVGAYPPGIPLWVPGEPIDEVKINWLRGFLADGGSVTGLEPGALIRVTS